MTETLSPYHQDAVSILKCPNCGASVYKGMTRCEYCGTGLSFQIVQDPVTEETRHTVDVESKPWTLDDYLTLGIVILILVSTIYWLLTGVSPWSRI
jgi:uncharacterized OB-fold protein